MSAANKSSIVFGLAYGLAALSLAACGGQKPGTATTTPLPIAALEAPSAPEPLQDSGWYELSLRGQKIGYAQQLVVITPESAILRHGETVTLTRGGAPLQIKTAYRATWDGVRWQGNVVISLNGEPMQLAARMTSSNGTIATRVAQAKAQQPWTPPDLLTLTAIATAPITGGYRVAARGVPTLQAPAESLIFPGQQATGSKSDGDVWRDDNWLQYALSTKPLPATAISHRADALPMSLRDLKMLVAEVGVALSPS